MQQCFIEKFKKEKKKSQPLSLEFQLIRCKFFKIEYFPSVIVCDYHKFWGILSGEVTLPFSFCLSSQWVSTLK